MNKSQLVDVLAARYEGNRKAAQHALESVLDTITREVARGEKVAITGFGSFEKRVRAAGWARNPATGDKIRTKKKAVPKFSPGQQLKNVVSGVTTLPKLASSTPAKSAASTTRSAPAKKTTAAKSATSTPAKKTTATKTAAKKAPVKKSATTTAAKKAPARKATTKTAAAKTTAAKTTASKTTATKKAPAKKATTSTATKKAPAKTTASKTTTSKTTAAKKAPAKKAPAKRAAQKS